MAAVVRRRLREDGYAGTKSPLYELIKELRPKEQRLMVRFEAVPGEFAQHDFDDHDVSRRAVQPVHEIGSRPKLPSRSRGA